MNILYRKKIIKNRKKCQELNLKLTTSNIHRHDPFNIANLLLSGEKTTFSVFYIDILEITCSKTNNLESVSKIYKTYTPF
jgi:hypothetical protein